MKTGFFTVLCAVALFSSCKKGCTDSAALNYDSKAKKEDNSCKYPEVVSPNLVIKLKFDSTQARLDNFGQPATIPNTNAALSPVFHKMSAHYIELAPTSITQLGDGEVVYKGAETSAGGSAAVDFSKAITVSNGEVIYTLP